METSKKKYFLLASIILISVLAFDQWLKIWVLKHMYLGQTKPMIGNWFYLHFTENNGMAFGVELGGITGKLILTVFRLLAVAGIIWYLLKQITAKAHSGLIVCISLILAGAIGNIIDSVFYGVWFTDYVTYDDKGKFFLGRVVDMLYFPVIETRYPSWFPFWAGTDLTFFRPIFNIADASISTGVISIIVFQKRFFGHKLEESLLVEEPDNSEEEVNIETDSPASTEGETTDNTIKES
ncbi:MAG: lipoprotein signal peptidase [Bacteroidia bacterium]